MSEIILQCEDLIFSVLYDCKLKLLKVLNHLSKWKARWKYLIHIWEVAKDILHYLESFKKRHLKLFQLQIWVSCTSVLLQTLLYCWVHTGVCGCINVLLTSLQNNLTTTRLPHCFSVCIEVRFTEDLYCLFICHRQTDQPSDPDLIVHLVCYGLSPYKASPASPHPQTGYWWNAAPGIFSELTGWGLQWAEIRSSPCLNMHFTMGVFSAALTAEAPRIEKSSHSVCHALIILIGTASLLVIVYYNLFSKEMWGRTKFEYRVCSQKICAYFEFKAVKI